MPSNIWTTLLTPIRFGQDHASPIEQDRSPFLVDYDRIIFSSSFRRLAKKTQVHPLTRNDHIHTRLTHSLEVSCVGRSLGNKVGAWLKEKDCLPDSIQPHNIGEIVQAACLAHDIGNPPFGHAGEDAFETGSTLQKIACIYLKVNLKTYKYQTLNLLMAMPKGSEQ